MTRVRLALLTLLALATASGVRDVAAAAATDAVTLETRVQRILEEPGPTGRVERRYEDVALVLPGDRLRYVIEYGNTSEEATVEPDTLVITTPVPPDLRYLPGSAEGANAVITVSTNGESFAPERAPASAATPVSHLRWRIGTALAPGEGGLVSFEAVLE
ncbi:MAG: hypothetical protein V2J02_21580 [Pseudomonadales bacterium]|nr:hypothetical protein [Pseudomonadales bacterium]